MTITLTDRSSTDEAPPVAIDDDAKLVALLARFQSRQPGFYELNAENGYALLLGIGEEYGVAQFSSQNGEPPYLVTVGNGKAPLSDSVEFLMADESTEIESKHCLPMPDIAMIAKYFRETGERHPEYKWEPA